MAFLQRKMGPMALTGSILAFTGALLLIIEAAFTGYMLISMSGTISAQGRILSCAHSARSCQPTVQFQTRGGEQVTFHSSWSSSTFKPGDSVTVRYHPDGPQEAQIDLWMVNRFLLPILGGIGLLLLVVGLLLVRFAKRHPSVDIIDRYYTAMKNRDYSTAFQYLNPVMKTREGEPVTLDWFSRRAQAYDAASGSISNTTITNFSLTPNRAKFTVKIKRGEQYKVHLYLSREGDTWRITGFDLF